MKIFHFFLILIICQSLVFADVKDYVKSDGTLDMDKIIKFSFEYQANEHRYKPSVEDENIDIDIMGLSRVMRAINTYDPQKVDEALKRSSNACGERYKDGDLLDYALKQNYSTIVKLILDRCPDFSVTKERLFRYVDSYPNYNDPDIIELLLQKGNLSINVTDSDGKTLIHHALKYAELFEIKYLLSKKINLNIKDKNGLNAQDTAKSWLKIYEERNAKTPWDETQKRIKRLNDVIPLLEKANNVSK